MKVTKPDYYKEFKCIASQCPETCCAGWEIGIDGKTLNKYKNETGPFGNRLHNSINWKRKSFHQYEKQCIFLSDDKLCDIYTEVGPEMMCHTCKTYPRHLEIYGLDREVSLTISCPEVARMILNKKNKVQFISSDEVDKIQAEKEKQLSHGFDKEVYEYLVDVRKVMFNILQTREYSISTRMAIVLGLAHDIQTRLDNGKVTDIPYILKRYQTPKIMKYLGTKVSKNQEQNSERYGIMKEYMKLIGTLDVLNIRWEVQLHKARRILYGCSNENDIVRKHIKRRVRKPTSAMGDADRINYYTTMVEQFKTYMDHEDWQIAIEQLMVYFTFAYVCTAAYDGDVYTKMKLAVVSTLIIKEMCFAQWLEQGHNLMLKDMITFAYQYGREVEHLEQNLNRLEKLLAKKKEFQLDKLILAL